MAHNIILVRHGEQLDAEHGVIDGPLSPRGIAQAEAVGRRPAEEQDSRRHHLRRLQQAARDERHHPVQPDLMKRGPGTTSAPYLRESAKGERQCP